MTVLFLKRLVAVLKRTFQLFNPSFTGNLNRDSTGTTIAAVKLARFRFAVLFAAVR